MNTTPDPESPYTRTTTGSRNSARRRVVLATAGVAVGAVAGTAFVTAALPPAGTAVASHATTVATGEDDDSTGITGTSTSITAPAQAAPQTAPVTTSGGS